jgi:hypothetical protein
MGADKQRRVVRCCGEVGGRSVGRDGGDLRRRGSMGRAGDVGLKSASSNVVKISYGALSQPISASSLWVGLTSVGRHCIMGWNRVYGAGVRKGDAGGAYAPKCLQGDDVCAVLIRSERLRGMVRQSPAVSLCLYTPIEKVSCNISSRPLSDIASRLKQSILNKVHQIRRQIHPEEQSPINAIGLAI